MNVSVAIGTYNGEKYLREQLDSILIQLNEEDEIIISDDNSNDKTMEILKEYEEKYKKIFIYKNKDKGVISNFENAISHTSKDIILLCDQDDVWLNNKVEVIKNYFKNSNASLVMSDCYVVDSKLKVIEESFFKLRGTKKGILKNIIKNSYLGCAMAFRKEMKNKILPIPSNTPMHDMWIGILAEVYGEVIIGEEKLFYYRRHEHNVTKINKKIDLKKAIFWRITLVVNLIKRRSKIRKGN